MKRVISMISLQVSYLKTFLQILCNAPGTQLSNKDQSMMTQSAEEMTDENHSTGMVGGHRKVLSGFLKHRSLTQNNTR